MTRWYPLVLLIALGGCSTVHTTTPVGDRPAVLEAADWNGRWCDATTLAASPGGTLGPDGDCVTVTVVDSANGIVDMVEDGEGHGRDRVHLRGAADDGWMLVTIEDDAGFGFVGRLRREGRVVITWAARESAFHEDVTAGRLPGHAEEHETYLEPVERGAVDRIVADDGNRLFDWRSPGVLIRMNDE